jgi:hypothetical protein
MLTLGILLFVVLTFAAALIAGVRVPTAIVIAAAMTAALCFSNWRSGGPTIRS